jgi:hypothetical protein
VSAKKSPNLIGRKMETMLLLGQTADWWNKVMIASLVFVAFTTACAVFAAKREAAANRAELERYQAQVAAQVEEAKSNAALANERAAKFGKDAAEANLKAEVLKKELGWREVTSDQATKLRAALDGKSMSIVLHWGMGDAEASHFSAALALALRDAGLVIAGGSPVGQLGEERHGILVAGWKEDEVNLLAAALQEAGYGQVDKKVVPPPTGSNAPGQYTDIFVGYRVAPRL